MDFEYGTSNSRYVQGPLKNIDSGSYTLRPDLEERALDSNSNINGFLIGDNKSLFYLPNHFSSKEGQIPPMEVGSFGNVILSLYEGQDGIYVGTRGGSPNFISLKDGLEYRTIKDDDGHRSWIDLINQDNEGEILVGGNYRTFTERNGKQLVAHKTLKDNNIKDIDE
ncbi:MAG: hypothetical protein ABEI74_03800 [Candidatus Pacearchaeota archaeon]